MIHSVGRKQTAKMTAYRFKNFRRSLSVGLAIAITIPVILTGCGEDKPEETIKPEQVEETQVQESEPVEESSEENTISISGIDFDSLQAKNPDIFAWLKVPGTDIDMPVCQSMEASDYYMSHNSDGASDADGAAYIEIPVMPDMCDFNTVIHGSRKLFGGLIDFENPDFFEKNTEFYVYLPDNVLTYTIWAVFRRENNRLIGAYSFVHLRYSLGGIRPR